MARIIFTDWITWDAEKKVLQSVRQFVYFCNSVHQLEYGARDDRAYDVSAYVN